MNIRLNDLTRRIKATDDFIAIDKEKCNGCGKCRIICVMNLFKIHEGKAILSENFQEKCLECGGCFQVCQKYAISFKYPSGGTGIMYQHG